MASGERAVAEVRDYREHLDEGRAKPRTVHAGQIHHRDPADVIVVAPRRTLLGTLQPVEPDGLVAQESAGAGQVLCALRPSEPEHLNRLFHVVLLSRPALQEPMGNRGQVRPAACEGRLSRLDLVPSSLDLLSQLVGYGEDLVRPILGQFLLCANQVQAVLAGLGRVGQEMVHVGLQLLLLKEELQRVDTSLVDLIASVHGAEKGQTVGIVGPEADVALHGREKTPR